MVASRRASRARSLALWMNGIRVGTWRVPSRGAMELHYDPAWVSSAEGRPLSLSLPFRLDDRPHSGAVVESWFDNLLPDNDAIRRRLAARFAAGTTPFELLGAIGRDCVGAVQITPEDEPPADIERIAGKPLDEAGIAALLRGTVAGARPPGTEADDLRISLAGAQEKTALLRHRGRWMKPLGTTPTTHIFKLPLGLVGNRQADMRTSVENEWLCGRILSAYGLPVASSEIAQFEDQKVLIVERFDRMLHASRKWWLRRPQEDFCQVLGVPPYRKYEADGGPGMPQIAEILRNSESASEDLKTLMTAQLLFWMLAATDGHAKNFSVRLLPGGRYRLAPLYDVLSAWPIAGEGPGLHSWHKLKLAMSVRGTQKHYTLKSIRRRHFNAIAPACLLQKTAEAIIEHVLARTPAVIEEAGDSLPAGFPARVAKTVLGGLKQQATRLAAMPPD